MSNTLHSGPFPEKEADLNNYIITGIPYLLANKVRLGISATNVTALNSVLTGWNTNYPPTTNANTRTKTATMNKDAAKEQVLTVMRAVFADIPESALIPADRTTLNLYERAAASINPAPDTRPLLKVSTANRLEHSISFTDEATPSSPREAARRAGRGDMD